MENKTKMLTHILPAKDLYDERNDLVVPLSDKTFFSTILASLKEWVATRKPSVIIEHDRNGEALGFVENIIEDENGIFAEIVLENAEEAKNRRYVSPTIAWNHKADDYSDRGDSWPAALLELSFVSVPRHSRQVPATETQMSEKNNPEVFYSENERTSYFSYDINDASVLTEYDQKTKENIDMDLEKLSEMLSALLDERLAAILERLDKLEGDGEEEPAEEEVVEAAEEEGEEPVVEAAEEEVVEEEKEEEVVEAAEEEEKEEESSLSEIAELNSRIRELEKRSVLAEARAEELAAELAHRDAVDAVAADVADRPHLSTMSERLVGILKRDEGLYKEVLEVVPSTNQSVFGERLTVGFSKKDTAVSNPYEAASKLSAEEGISYREAFERLTR